MMLIIAIAILTLVVGIGGWLGALYLMIDSPPARLGWPGLLHGAGGAAGVVVMIMALRTHPAGKHAIKMGVGGFGIFAGVLLVAALTVGLTLMLTHLRRRAVSATVVAVHGGLAIVGYVLLLTYLTMLT
jgi:hypothetical protein